MPVGFVVKNGSRFSTVTLCAKSGHVHYRLWLACVLALGFQPRAILWFSGTAKQSVVLIRQVFIEATEYIPAQAHDLSAACAKRCLWHKLIGALVTHGHSDP
jgi:hypothetical protein